MPVLDTIRRHPRNLLIAMGARVADNATFYIYTVFIITFATQPSVGFSRTAVLAAVAIAAIFQMIMVPIYARLSDSIGRRPVYLFGAAGTILFAFPFFWLIETSRTSLLILAAVTALAVVHSGMYGPQASFFSELFGTRVRYTGASIGYQLTSVLAGGLAPLIATYLLKETGRAWPVALYVALMGA